MFLFCRWMIASVAVGPDNFLHRWCLCHRRYYMSQTYIFLKMSSLKAETEFQLEDMPLWSTYCLIKFQQGKTRAASLTHTYLQPNRYPLGLLFHLAICKVWGYCNFLTFLHISTCSLQGSQMLCCKHLT